MLYRRTSQNKTHQILIVLKNCKTACKGGHEIPISSYLWGKSLWKTFFKNDFNNYQIVPTTCSTFILGIRVLREKDHY